MARRATPHALTRLLAGLAALAFGAPALAQSFAGTYRTVAPTGPVTVVITQAGDRLSGWLQAPGLVLELEGWVGEGVGVGVASSAQGPLGFETVVEGDLLELWLYEVVNGAVRPGSEVTLTLGRVVAQAAPTQSGGKLTVPGTTSPADERPGSPVIATGTFASLTLDDAEAFVEAVEFALDQAGYGSALSAAERQRAVQELARTFPTLPRDEQVALSQARATWEQVRAGWALASLAERRAFVTDVLALAFGQPAVGGHAGSGACSTFEDCADRYADGGVWLDTFGTQGCWAAAGCEGYDPATGTFDHYGDH